LADQQEIFLHILVHRIHAIIIPPNILVMWCPAFPAPLGCECSWHHGSLPIRRRGDPLICVALHKLWTYGCPTN